VINNKRHSPAAAINSYLDMAKGVLATIMQNI
jgi:hypothetical protein